MLDQFKELVRTFLLKTFDIREGEYQRVLLMQLNIFLLIFTLLIIKPVVNAQFLSVIGIEQLPVVFVLVAASAMLVSAIYSRALNTKSLRSVTTNTLIISILGLVTVGILLSLNVSQKLVLYILYIGVAIFGVLSTSQFWIMANLAFDAREAKRVFGFIGAGPIAGGVAGGYMASVLTNFMEGTHLLFFGAFLLCFCIPLNNIIWKKHITNLNTFQKQKRLKDFGDHPFWLIRKSKHLSYLALIIGIGVLVSKLVEFQFSSVAVMAYEDPDELTAFFGFWMSTFNVVSLLTQLFITRRIVGTYGVGSSLFVLPGGILVGSAVLLATPVLWVGVFTKLWEVSMKQSVNKSATELLALPIPASIKSQTKSFIDVFVDLAATGLAGLLLIFIVSGLELSIRAVSVLTIVILMGWIWVAFKVRKEYLNSFKSKLTQADRKSENDLPDYSNTSVLDGLKKALSTGTENQIIYVLNKVREIPDKRLFENVVGFLTHDSSRVRLQALMTIYYLERTVESEILEKLLHDPEQEVRYKAFEQLIRQTKEKRILLINEYLTHHDPLISGAALVGLAEEARNNLEMKKQLKIAQRIQEKLDYMHLVEDPEEKDLYKVMVLRAIGQANIPELYSIIDGYLDDQDSQTQNEAILAAGLTMNVKYVARLASFLVNKKTRPAAQKALLNFGVGIVQELEKLANSETVGGETIHMIPGVLEQIDSHLAVNALLSFLDRQDVMLRLEALRSLNTMQRDFPHLKIDKKDVIDNVIDECNLYKNILGIFYRQSQLLPSGEPTQVHHAREQLIELLERRLDGTLERIFRLIGLRYPPDDVITAYQGIRSVNETVRLNSVEYLDNLLEPSLKKALLPIVESAFLEDLSKETISQLKVSIPDEKSYLSMLLEGRDAKLKMAVLLLVESLGGLSYSDILQPLLNSPNEKIRTRCQEVLDKLH